MQSGSDTTAGEPGWTEILTRSTEPWRSIAVASHDPNPTVRREAVKEAWEEATRALGRAVPAYGSEKERFLEVLFQNVRFTRPETSRIRFAHYLRTLAAHDRFEVPAGTAFAAVAVLADAAARVEGATSCLPQPEQLVATRRFGDTFSESVEGEGPTATTEAQKATAVLAQIEDRAWAEWRDAKGVSAASLRSRAVYRALKDRWEALRPRGPTGAILLDSDSMTVMKAIAIEELAILERAQAADELAPDHLCRRQFVADLRTGEDPVMRHVEAQYERVLSAASGKRQHDIVIAVLGTALYFGAAVPVFLGPEPYWALAVLVPMGMIAWYAVCYLPLISSLGGPARVKFVYQRIRTGVQ